MQKSPNNQEVREFINYLKHEGIYKLYDVNKSTLIYHSQDKTKLPFDFISDLFAIHCPTSKWEEQGSYVTACLQKIIGFYFKPSSSKLIDVGCGANKLNTYQYFSPTVDTADCPLFIELLVRMLPIEGERKIFTQWLAHMIQQPDIRPTWAVMLTSDEGTGKGVLFNQILTPILSRQTRLCSTYGEFIGGHSTALADTLMIMLDDVKSKSDSQITELKSKISEPSIVLNPKYEQPFSQQVFARILLASNEIRPIKLGNNDTRRWFAPQYIKHRYNRAESQMFFDKMLGWIDTDTDSLSKIYNYLMHFSLEGFSPNIVERTPTLDTMVELSESSRETSVKDWVLDKKVFKLEELYSHFEDYKDLAKQYAAPYCDVRKANPDGGNRSMWWIVSGIDNATARSILEGELPTSIF